MISHRSAFEQRMQGLSAAAGHLSSLVSFSGQVASNLRRWRVNRRDLRGLDRDQMRDTGLTREMIDDACRFSLGRR